MRTMKFLLLVTLLIGCLYFLSVTMLAHSTGASITTQPVTPIPVAVPSEHKPPPSHAPPP